MIENANKIVNSHSFKNLIEFTGRGCKLICTCIEDNKIVAFCKANVQNDIIFKVVFDDYKCIELWNHYNLYNKEDFTARWQAYLQKIKDTNKIPSI